MVWPEAWIARLPEAAKSGWEAVIVARLVAIAVRSMVERRGRLLVPGARKKFSIVALPMEMPDVERRRVKLPYFH